LEISVSSELNFARSQEEANATKCKTNIIWKTKFNNFRYF
jgi:hypothetical protein